MCVCVSGVPMRKRDTEDGITAILQMVAVVSANGGAQELFWEFLIAVWPWRLEGS